MMIFRTIRGRLLTGILVLTALGLLGTDLAIYFTIRSTVAARVDRSLVNAADAVAHPTSKPDVLLDNLQTILSRTEISVIMLDADGRVIAASPAAATAQQPYPLTSLDSRTLALVEAQTGGPERIERNGRPFRVLYRPIPSGVGLTDQAGVSRRATGVIVSSAFLGEQTALAQLAVVETVVSLGVLAVIALLAVVVLRVGLRPLGGMAAAATTIANGGSDQRLPVERPHSEVGRLAAALNQAFDERGRAEERLRQFVADASHELKTPLATIRGWADLYFQDALAGPDGVDTAMTRIITDADRVIRLVEELLLLARLDELRGLDAVRIDLAQLVGEVVGDARMADTGRRITIMAPEAVMVTGDQDRLCQVIRNLVGNALRHTPPGTGVTVTLEQHPAATVLTVADEGPGIPGPDLDRIFDRFYRPPGSRSNGSGLGLAITRAIVRAHHGTITVDSAPGAGARFHVTLPA
jgi:two-component system, OmpR family, sensor kinase